MIKVNNLTKNYGNTRVLNIEEIEIPKGQVLGLVGNNGAGKTTFFNLILDLIGEIIGKRKYLRDLSKGNQKKAGIVGALIGNPEVIILDEPFANLDPTTQIRLKKLLKSLVTDSKATILISSHDLGHVTEVCNRIVILDKGDVVKDIATSEATLQELEAHFTV